MSNHQLHEIPTDRLRAPGQVRKHFDESSLVGLAVSLQQSGMLQPIVATQKGDTLEIVLGERRWRAAKKAGLATVPVRVLDGLSDEAAKLVAQLAENLQRSRLKPLEAAQGIRRLMEVTGEKQGRTARRVGMSQGEASKLLSLLNLPEEIQAEVATGKIAKGTGYAIARAKEPAEQTQLAEQAIDGQLTRDAANLAVKREQIATPEKQRRTVSRAVAKLGERRVVTVNADELTLDSYVSLLVELLGRARKAQRRGVDLSTFLKLLNSENKKEPSP